MAVRLRADGRVLCAAMHPEKPGDAYLDDGLAYWFSVELRLLVTEPMDLPEGVGRGGHGQHGEWWWRGAEPEDAVIDEFYAC